MISKILFKFILKIILKKHQISYDSKVGICRNSNRRDCQRTDECSNKRLINSQIGGVWS